MTTDGIWAEIGRNNADVYTDDWRHLDELIRTELGTRRIPRRRLVSWRRAFLGTLAPFVETEEFLRGRLGETDHERQRDVRECWSDVRAAVERAAAAEARRQLVRRGEGTLTRGAVLASLLPVPWLSNNWWGNHNSLRDHVALFAGVFATQLFVRVTISPFPAGGRWYRALMTLTWMALLLSVPSAVLLRNSKPPLLLEVLLDSLLALDCAILLLALILPLHARIVERADPVEQLVARMVRLVHEAYFLAARPNRLRAMLFPAAQPQRMNLVRQIERAARDLHRRFLHADSNRLFLPVGDVQLYAELHARAHSITKALRDHKIHFLMPPRADLTPVTDRLSEQFLAACMQDWVAFEQVTEGAPAIPRWRRTLPRVAFAISLSGAAFALPQLLNLTGEEQTAVQVPLLLAATFGLFSLTSSTIDNAHNALSSALNALAPR